MGLKEELEASYNPKVAKVLVEATKSAPYPSLLGFEVVEQRPGFIRCKLPVSEKLYSGVGLLHGGAMISLVDHVLSIVVYPHIEPGRWAATLDLKVSYIAPVTEGELWADAEITSLRRRLGTVRIDVSNKKGDAAPELVAQAMGTVYVKDKPKPP